jgi:hypothetical protein
VMASERARLAPRSGREQRSHDSDYQTGLLLGCASSVGRVPRQQSAPSPGT